MSPELASVLDKLRPMQPATIPDGERLRVVYFIFNGRLPVIRVQRWDGGQWQSIDWTTTKAWGLQWLENRPRTNDPMDDLPIGLEMLRRAGVVWEGEVIEVPEPPRVTTR